MPTSPDELAALIREWGRELGFQAIGFSGIDLAAEEPRLAAWLAAGAHGTMGYMERHGLRRARPSEIVPGTVSVVTARMEYLAPGTRDPGAVLADPALGYVARYALGRDYHKLIRTRLQRLADRIAEVAGPFGHRVFTDSGPILEKALAERSGLGWRGRHSLMLARDGGSWFFLGEILTDLSLPADEPVADHCGSCTACIDICPTGAIVAPYRVEARRCIAYLTIAHEGPIPEALRPLMGNRIYGCDDCQIVCPWNRFARPTPESDFLPRHGLDAPRLVELFSWTEDEFRARMEGSAIRRIGHERWLRNIAVALGNGPPTEAARSALAARTDHPSAVVREHVAWALRRLAG